jgi:hypothetical protein
MARRTAQADTGPSEIAGIRSLIACNDDYTLSQFPNLNVLVVAGITFHGKIPINDTLTLSDPSMEQYAAAINSDKSLEVLFSMSTEELPFDSSTGSRIVSKRSFTDIMRPMGTNTKMDVLTLAALVHDEGKAKIAKESAGKRPPKKESLTSLEFILKYIKSQSGDRTAGFTIDFESYDFHTPLWHACRNGKWEAVKKLFEAGANFFKVQKNARCPVLQGLSGTDGADFIENVLKPLPYDGGDLFTYVAKTLQWTKDLVPVLPDTPAASESDTLGQILTDRPRKAGILGTVIEILLGKKAEGTRTGVLVENPAAKAKTPPPPKHDVPVGRPDRCFIVSCEDHDELDQCPACKKWFCPDHIKEECPGHGRSD